MPKNNNYDMPEIIITITTICQKIIITLPTFLDAPKPMLEK